MLINQRPAFVVNLEKPLMYTSTVNFEGDIDSALLPAHLADCLRRVDGRYVTVEQNRVSFTSGLFRLVSNWNVLVPFGFGDLMVDAAARRIRYRLSYRQLMIFATVMAGVMAVFISFVSRTWAGLVFIPFMYIWLVGANLAIGIPRFDGFLRRAIETAPCIKR
jgi:hypothetical protein